MRYNEKPTPVLLGADLNAYSVAVAFHEAYGVRSYAMGKYKCGLTSYSKIVKMKFCSGYEDTDVFLPELISFARLHQNEKLVLVPCADCYVEFINKYESELKKYYAFIIPREELRKKLTDKAAFYSVLKKHGLTYPEFISIYSPNVSEAKLSRLSYPLVLKPAKSAEYWHHPFPDMRKVYYPDTAKSAEEIIKKIYYHGYSGELLLQKKIENADIYVFTALFDRESNCDFSVFGKVVLEECGKTSEGNHSAIITEKDNELTQKIKDMLQALGYTGFANFDILYSNGEYYILELNARQGRSCDHIRCSGINIAERLMGVLEDGDIRDKVYPKKIFWHYPSFNQTLKYMKNDKDIALAKKLKSSERAFSPLSYKSDLITNPLRLAYVTVHNTRLGKTLSNDFSNNCCPQEEF